MKKIVYAILAALLGGYIALLLVTELPFFQKRLAQITEETISKKLGTKVSVSKTEIGLFNRLILHDVTIKDQNGKELLSTARLSLKLKMRSILRSPLTIRTIELYGAKINLYKKNENAPYNFKFVVDSLSSKDNTSQKPLDLRIKSIIISKSSIRHEVWNASPRKGIDINHLYLDKIDASINLQIINSDSVKVRVRNFAFQEKNGFTLRRSYIIANFSKRGCSVRRLLLETNKSKLEANNVKLSIVNGKIKDGTGTIQNTFINIADFNALFPSVNVPDRTYTISSAFKIRNNVISSDNIHITRSKNADILIAAHYGDTKHFKADIRKLVLSENETVLLSGLAGKDSTLQVYAQRLGQIECLGKIERTTQTLNMHGEVNSQIGKINFAGKFPNVGNFMIRANAESFKLGDFLSRTDLFGNTSFDVSCEGFSRKDFSASVKVPQIEVNKYAYNDIGINITATNGNIKYDLNTNDSNADITVNGMLVNVGTKKHITINGDIQSINPNALYLTSKYPDTKLRMNVNADILASDKNNVTGNIRLNNLEIVHPDSIFALKSIELTVYPISNGQLFALSGDFGTAELRGSINFSTLPRDFINILRTSKDAGDSNSTVFTTNKERLRTKAHTLPHNNFTFNASITDFSLLNQLCRTSIYTTGNNVINGYIDSHEGRTLVEGRLSNLQLGGHKFSDISIYCKGDASMSRSNLHITKERKNGSTNIEIAAKRNGNAIDCNIMWKGNGEHKYSGDITQTITFPTDEAGVVNFNVAPSAIVIEDSLWNISPALLSYAGGRLNISDFRMNSGKKQLELSGTVSKLATDSLQLRLSGIRINEILDMVAFDDVTFDGTATGVVSIASVSDTPALNANLSVSDFKFNDAVMGDMKLIGVWNDELKQIDLNALIEDSQGTTGVNGFVNTKQKTIDLNFEADNTNALFLNKFLPDAVQLESGRTAGRLRLHGKLNAMNLAGSQRLSGVTVSVVPLGTTYAFDGDVIDFSDDVIAFNGLDLLDRHGNHAEFTGKVMHRALHDFSYDFNIATDKFLAYDCPRTAESSFWGTAYTNGNIRVYGQPGQFWTEATVQPAAGTVFVYNADRPDAPENVRLLTYNDADAAIGDTVRKNTAVAPQRKEEKTTDIRLNFTFDMSPEAEVRVIMNEAAGNIISVRGTGNLHAMYYNKGSFEMFGNYDILDGTYKMTIQDLIHKDFKFRSGGTVAFNGDPFAGDLNLQAVYTVQSVSLGDLMADGNLRDNSVKVDCIMNFSGSVGQPVVDFDLDMPSISTEEQQMVRSLISTREDMNMQIVYLLSFGRFYTYNYASQAVAASQSRSSLAMNSFLSNTLSSNLNTLLSNVMDESTWTFGTNVATGNDGWNDMDVEGLVTGRLFNNRLILNGNFGYRDRSAYNSNFVGDFSVLYLLNRRGTIQLKAYSESNDRYFTKSTLTTQGGGIIFKRNFTRFDSLFKRNKAKTKTRAASAK